MSASSRCSAESAETLRPQEDQHRRVPRARGASYLPPKSEDPKLEGFFDQWVYGTGIPSLKMTYSVKGKAPALRVVGTIEQSGRGRGFQRARAGGDPASARQDDHAVGANGEFAGDLHGGRHVNCPSKVLLDPRRSILRQ